MTTISKRHENDPLWDEKYRPKTIGECILPRDLQRRFASIVETNEVPNMILSGTSGLGKTTVARALCDQLDCDYIMINGSENNGIDILRTKVRQFASTVSLSGGGKVVIIDEADYLNPSSTQPALRAFIEEFPSCRFILTCNYRHRLIDALHSRCPPIEFTFTRKMINNLSMKFFRRMEDILKKEGVTYQQKLLGEVVLRFAPDWRRVIKECQQHVVDGELLPTIIDHSSQDNINELVGYLREKDFRSMRVWVAENGYLDSSVVFRRLYEALSGSVKPSSIPQAVLIIAEYQYKAAFVADPEINTTACLTEMMRSLKWEEPSK